MSIKAVFFDMDDTLVATRGMGLEVMESVLKEHDVILEADGIDGFDQAWRSGSAANTERWLKEILITHGSGGIVDALLEDFYTQYAHGMKHAPLVAGC